MAETFLPAPPPYCWDREEPGEGELAVVWLLASRGNRITFKGLLLHLHPSISNSVRPAGLAVYLGLASWKPADG